MWGSIVALHGRYPRHLEHLKDGWWDDEATAETLCALAVWRAEIDQHGRDPREELAFHHQLADYAHTCASRAAASKAPGTRAHRQRTGSLASNDEEAGNAWRTPGAHLDGKRLES